MNNISTFRDALIKVLEKKENKKESYSSKVKKIQSKPLVKKPKPDIVNEFSTYGYGAKTGPAGYEVTQSRGYGGARPEFAAYPSGLKSTQFGNVDMMDIARSEDLKAKDNVKPIFPLEGSLDRLMNLISMIYPEITQINISIKNNKSIKETEKKELESMKQAISTATGNLKKACLILQALQNSK